jgi:hypothetical protein
VILGPVRPAGQSGEVGRGRVERVVVRREQGGDVDAVLTAGRKPDGAPRQDDVMRYALADKP